MTDMSVRVVLVALLDELFELLLKSAREANISELGSRDDISQQLGRLLAGLLRTYQENRTLWTHAIGRAHGRGAPGIR